MPTGEVSILRADDPSPLTRQQLRTPRSAAIAGIIFAVLLATTMVLIQVSIPSGRLYDPAWLRERTTEVSIAVGLVPFASIAFLWFIGVIRDQLGEREDRFFSTVFLGSGVVFLGLLLVWSGLIGAALATVAADPAWANTSSFRFAASIVDVLGGTGMLRMAGVFVLSTGTMWLRTRVMPRWIVWLTYVLAVVMLVGGGSLRPLRLVFPVWVLVVSIPLLRAAGSSDWDTGASRRMHR